LWKAVALNGSTSVLISDFMWYSFFGKRSMAARMGKSAAHQSAGARILFVGTILSAIRSAAIKQDAAAPRADKKNPLPRQGVE